MKGRAAGNRCLGMAIQGRGECCLIECGLDGGIAPRTLEARRVSYTQVCQSCREVAHTVPHTHAAKKVVASVQRGWQGCRIMEVG